MADFFETVFPKTNSDYILAGLQEMTWDVSPEWTWTPDETNDLNHFNKKTDIPWWFEKVEIGLAGAVKDSATEPWKTMNAWYDQNKVAIEKANLMAETEVSSWAIVVTATTVKNADYKTGRPDVLKGWGYLYPPHIQQKLPSASATSGNNYADAPNSVDKYVCLPINWDKWDTSKTLLATKTESTHIFSKTDIPMWMCGGAGPGEIPKNTDGTTVCDRIKSAWNFNWDTESSGVTNNRIQYIPQVGDIGDSIAVYIHNNSNPHFKPYAIRLANVAIKKTVIDFKSTVTVATPGVSEFQQDSWEAIFPNVANWADIEKSGLDSDLTPTWVRGASCNTDKWITEDACFGIEHPWIAGELKAPSATTNGSFQAYHWLADENPQDPTKVFQIEKDDELTMLIWEGWTPTMMQWDLSQFKKLYDAKGNNAAWDLISGSYNLQCDYATRQNNWSVSRHIVQGANQLLAVTAVIVGSLTALL